MNQQTVRKAAMAKPLITQHAQYEFTLSLLHGIQASLIALESSIDKMDDEDVKAAISANRFVAAGAFDALLALRKWEGSL